jgi:hypothetical protein
VIKIKKRQVLARITIVKQDLVGNIFPVPSMNLGIETESHAQYQSQVLLEEKAPSPLTTDEQEALEYILGQIQLSPNLTTTQQVRLKRLLSNNIRAFSRGATDLGCTTVLSHDIITEGEPVK